MGKRGPQPLPTAVKAARGTLQKCRTPKDEPKPTVGAPPPPRDLDATERRRYAVIAAEQVAIGVMTVIDGESLAQLARALVRVERLRRIVRGAGRDGEFETDTDGVTRLSAAARALVDAERWLADCNARFGRDPRARASVKAAPVMSAKDAEAAERRARFAILGAGKHTKAAT